MAASHPALQPHAGIADIIAIGNHCQSLINGRISVAQFRLSPDWHSHVLLSPQTKLMAARTMTEWESNEDDEEDENPQDVADNQQLSSTPGTANAVASGQRSKPKPSLFVQGLSSQTGSTSNILTVLLPENCTWDGCDKTWGQWWPDADKLTVMFNSDKAKGLRLGILDPAVGSIQPCSVHHSWDDLCHFSSGYEMRLSPDGQYISAMGPWQLYPRVDSWSNDTMRIFSVIQGHQIAQLRSFSPVWSSCSSLVAVDQYVEKAEWLKEVCAMLSCSVQAPVG